MISPEWGQIKIGPLLRGESDLRLYHDIFKPRAGQIKGLRRMWLQCIASKKPEPGDFSFAQETGPSRGVIVVFEGEKDRFCRLNGWSQFLYGEIRAMARERWVEQADAIAEIPIGIHVRRGDFAEARSEADFRTKGSLRTPLAWFVQSLEVIRDYVGFEAAAHVSSDGRQSDIEDLLVLERVFRLETGSSVGDMLALSKARVLIASGGSSFSAWASFLGQMPTVSLPGQSLSWFGLQRQGGPYVGEFDAREPSEEFLEQAKEALCAIRNR